MCRWHKNPPYKNTTNAGWVDSRYIIYWLLSHVHVSHHWYLPYQRPHHPHHHCFWQTPHVNTLLLLLTKSLVLLSWILTHKCIAQQPGSNHALFIIHQRQNDTARFIKHQKSLIYVWNDIHPGHYCYCMDFHRLVYSKFQSHPWRWIQLFRSCQVCYIFVESPACMVLIEK